MLVRGSLDGLLAKRTLAERLLARASERQGSWNLRFLDTDHHIDERFIIVFVNNSEEAVFLDAQFAQLLVQVVGLVGIVQDADLITDGDLVVAVSETGLQELFDQVVQGSSGEVDVGCGVDDPAYGAVGVWRRRLA